jgi:Flp pilus assembly protein TadG
MNMLHKQYKKGQSLVEFAIIIPLFVLIVMFIFDIGRAVYYYSVLYNAVREGARVASVGETDINLLQSLVRDRAYGMDLPLGGVTIAPNPITTTSQLVTVSAVYSFSPITPLVARFLPGGTLNVSAESSMRLEFAP